MCRNAWRADSVVLLGFGQGKMIDRSRRLLILLPLPLRTTASATGRRPSLSNRGRIPASFDHRSLCRARASSHRDPHTMLPPSCRRSPVRLLALLLLGLTLPAIATAFLPVRSALGSPISSSSRRPSGSRRGGVAMQAAGTAPSDEELVKVFGRLADKVRLGCGCVRGVGSLDCGKKGATRSRSSAAWPYRPQYAHTDRPTPSIHSHHPHPIFLE